jgi:hypothetical protein
MDQIELARERDRCRAVVNAGYVNARDFLTS